MSTDLQCLSCGAAQTNGLALCDLCQFKAASIFEVLPIYFRNLARWRPGSAGIRSVPGSREPSSGVTMASDRISVALDEVSSDLVTWAKCLADDRFDGEVPASGDEAGSVKVACWFLTSNLTSVATLEWCGAMLDKLTEHNERLSGLTVEAAPGWYAGACHLCTTDTFVVPGITWVTCRGCGATTYARDHLSIVISEARDYLARPKALAEAVVCLLDTELSVPRLYERIKKWGQRGGKGGRGIIAVRSIDGDGDPIGPKRYVLGDVLDLIAKEGETSVSPIAAEAS